MRTFNKVFGIGFGRTGTTSLTEALTRIGLDIVHTPWDDRTLAQLLRGDYALDLLQHKDGITDIQSAAFYRQFNAAWPNSLFILTTRDYDSWLASIRQD